MQLKNIIETYEDNLLTSFGGGEEGKSKKILMGKSSKYLGIKENALDLILKGQSCKDS